jgi:hypothetical protein
MYLEMAVYGAPRGLPYSTKKAPAVDRRSSTNGEAGVYGKA